MILRMLLLFCALIASGVSYGQVRQFTEEFTDNSRGWFTTNTPNARLTIDRGSYLFDIRQEPFYHTWYNLELSENSQFNLRAETQHWGGVNQYGYGMYLAGQDSDNTYLFLISANGHYTFGRLDDGRWIPMKEWTPSFDIRIGTGQVNELGFVQREREWILSINGREQFRTQRQPFYGGFFGFSVENFQQVAFNRLLLSVGQEPVAVTPVTPIPTPAPPATAGPAPAAAPVAPVAVQEDPAPVVVTQDFCFSFTEIAKAASKGYEGSVGQQRPRGAGSIEDIFDTPLQLAGAEEVYLSRTTHNPQLRLVAKYAESTEQQEAMMAYEQLLQRLQVCLPELGYEEQRRDEPNAMFLRTATWRPTDLNSVVGRQFRELLLVVRLTSVTAYDDRFRAYKWFEVTMQLTKFR